MNAKLELRHLKAIHAIANTGNGTHAARTLNISQSALSHRLHEAERRLDIKLYQQVGKGLKLTPSGERLNQAAILCLEEMDMAEREVDLRKNDVEHVVKLGVTLYASFHWLPRLITKLNSKHANIDIEVITRLSANLFEMLHDNKINVAITARPVKNRKLKSSLLYRDELLAYLPAGHPKAKNKFFSADDFQDEIFVTETTEREWVGTHKSFFERLGTRPKRIMQVGHGEAVFALVKSGMAITAESRRKLAVYRKDKSIVSLPITKAGLFVEFFLVTEQNLDKTSPEYAVVKALKEVNVDD